MVALLADDFFLLDDGLFTDECSNLVLLLQPSVLRIQEVPCNHAINGLSQEWLVLMHLMQVLLAVMHVVNLLIVNELRVYLEVTIGYIIN